MIPTMRISHDSTDTAFVYGVGVEGKLTERTTARIEYLGFSDLDINVVRAGLNFKLGQ
jgi:opacity protein-like surface antigen